MSQQDVPIPPRTCTRCNTEYTVDRCYCPKCRCLEFSVPREWLEMMEAAKPKKKITTVKH